LGEEEKVIVNCHWLRAVAVDIVPKETLNLLTYRDKTLFVHLTQNLEHPLLQPQVIQFEIAELRHPDTSVKQGQDESIVPISFSGFGIYGAK